ncbi:MAG TPA: ice-binding family protein [Acidimicrobiales bacterium]|nr:ice-binding family protein [Acidimicrobiales bacterium]
MSILLVLALGVATFGDGSPAEAAEAPVGLGTAASFAVLGGQSVTNTGPSVISGDVGVSPGTSITGFPAGIVINGVFHATDAVAGQAQSDLTTAYNDAAGRATTAALPPDAGGLTLVSGVYTASSTLGLTGTLTLDAQGDPNAVFIFQVGSGLTTASFSTVSLINGASPCNVYWQIGSSATLATNSVFVGTVMALTSISANTTASIQGRLLARNGSVTLNNNTIFRPDCAPPTTTTTSPGGSTTVPGGGPTTSMPSGGPTTVPGGGTGTTVPGGGSGTTVPGGGTGGPGGPGGSGGPETPGGPGGPGGSGGPETPGGPGSGSGSGAAGEGAGLAGRGANARNGAAARTSGRLARTGAPLAATAVAGLLALLLGGAALAAARRRTSRPLV